MFTQSFGSPSSTVVPWPAASTARRATVGEPSEGTAREAWLDAFAGRMGELRPDEDEGAIRALAADLWIDVGSHDPMIAAEMEHEASFGSDL